MDNEIPINYGSEDRDWFNRECAGLSFEISPFEAVQLADLNDRIPLANMLSDAYELEMQSARANELFQQRQANYWRNEAEAERIKRESVERMADRFVARVKFWAVAVLVFILLAAACIWRVM